MLLHAVVSYIVLVITYNQFYINQPEPRDTWVMLAAGIIYGTCRLASLTFFHLPSRRSSRSSRLMNIRFTQLG